MGYFFWLGMEFCNLLGWKFYRNFANTPRLHREVQRSLSWAPVTIAVLFLKEEVVEERLVSKRILISSIFPILPILPFFRTLFPRCGSGKIRKSVRMEEWNYWYAPNAYQYFWGARSKSYTKLVNQSISLGAWERMVEGTDTKKVATFGSWKCFPRNVSPKWR